MKRRVVLEGILGILAVGLWPSGRARGAASVDVGVQTGNAQIGIHIGDPPPLVVVPGTAVYRAPSLPYNYFVYQKIYYVYHEGRWHRSRHHDGPWAVIAVGQVPPAIRGVHVDYYNAPPPHWKRNGPPPWAHAKSRKKKGRGKKRDRDRRRGHDRKRD